MTGIISTYQILAVLPIFLTIKSIYIHKPNNQYTLKRMEQKIYPPIEQYILSLANDIKQINPERKQALDELANYIAERKTSHQPIRLTFICTHNSRRSHFGQVWAAVMAHHFGIPSIQTYSGGTEATAFNHRAAAALERIGFKIQKPAGTNPKYELFFAENTPPLICFSKKYNDQVNPASDFAAIMTCSQADQACPLVPGANFRLSLPYLDPKAADDTPQESREYDERCRQIAAEMMYVFQQVR